MKFSHSGRRLSGLVIPLSAIRSDASPGCGEFPDLARAGDLASEWGLDLIQLLPVNDSGFQTSPYFALSAFALHPLYVRIGDLPELAAGTEKAGGDAAVALKSEAKSLIGRFSGEARVPHEAVLAAKLELLRKVWSFASETAAPGGRALLSALEAWIEEIPGPGATPPSSR